MNKTNENEDFYKEEDFYEEEEDYIDEDKPTDWYDYYGVNQSDFF